MVAKLEIELLEEMRIEDFGKGQSAKHCCH